MKTQEQLGAVHLRIEGLDKERFKKLVEGHSVAAKGLHYYLNNVVKEIYIENWFNSHYKWISCNTPSIYSKLITLDELEQLLGKQRTPEVIQAEIKALQAELTELNKIKAGDVILTKCGKIGIASDVNKRYNHIVTLSHSIYSDCTKIDPNKTVKEILGL